MKDKLLELTGRFDALSLRERSTIGAAVLLGGLMMGYLVLVDPQITRQAAQHKRITQMAAQEAQMVALKSQLKDPDAANRAALQEVRKSMAAIDQRLRNVQDSLVPPEKMQAFLEGLMTKDQGLELVALRTLSVAPLIKSTSAPGGKPSVGEDKTAKEHVEPAGKSRQHLWARRARGIRHPICTNTASRCVWLAATMIWRVIWQRSRGCRSASSGKRRS